MGGGKVGGLGGADSVIGDIVGAEDKLAHQETPNSKPIPLKIGDVLELNDHRARVVGICRVGRTFNSQPVVYPTYSRATTFAPRERKLLSFVLVKAKPGVTPADLCRRIESVTGLAAYTQKGFKDLTFWYFFKYTGIPINFGISVALGFIVGTAIAGQTFYNFTLDNLKLFGTLKAMGASNGTLLRMIVLQAVTVGAIGYGLGVGAASGFGFLTKNTELAFLMPWQLLAISAVAIALIC